MKRGDVVLLDHPFSDASGSKVRPALVVQGDRDNARLSNTIVALLTRNTSRLNEPTHLLVDPSTVDGRSTGLRQPSVVVFNNLFTVSRTKILRVIGSLPLSMKGPIDDCLKSALDLN